MGDCGCSHPHAAEPILAIAEGRDIAAFGSGIVAPSEEGEPPPLTQLRIERVHGRGELRKFALAHQRPFEGDVPCLPWVRQARHPERFRRCLAAARKLGPMDTSDKIAKFLQQQQAVNQEEQEAIGDGLLTENQEIFVTVQLDAQFLVLSVSEIARGARDHVEVPLPDVLRVVIFEGAVSYVAAHVHPSGNVTPSDADKNLTKALVAASQAVQVPLLDHLVIGSEGYVSLAERGWL